MIDIVHPDKVVKYLLNRTHRTGAPKARFFLSKGFPRPVRTSFADALKRHPEEAALISCERDPEGYKLVFECEIRIPAGSRTCIRSIWIETEG